MLELWGDIWSEETLVSERPNHTSKTSCQGHRSVAGVFLTNGCLAMYKVAQEDPGVMGLPDHIIKAAYNYEGSDWVAYDHQFWYIMLARRDLNWSVPNSIQQSIYGPCPVHSSLPTLPLRRPHKA